MVIPNHRFDASTMYSSVAPVFFHALFLSLFLQCNESHLSHTSNHLVNRVEVAGTDRGLSARNGLSSRQGDGIIRESCTLHCVIDPELELAPVPPQSAAASQVTVGPQRPHELEL